MPKEKSWGPNYLKFDLGLYASAGGDSGFVFYLQQERRWLNSLGLQWRNEVQLGYNTILSSTLYQPLDSAQRFFVQPKAFLTETREYIYYENERIAQYSFKDLGGLADLGVNFGRSAQLRAGYLYTNRKVSVDTGPDPAAGRRHGGRGRHGTVHLRHPRRGLRPDPRAGRIGRVHVQQ